MNAPVGNTQPTVARVDLEHALRVALQALEARWPRHFNADCQRDTVAVQVVNAALESIDAGKRMLDGGAGNSITTETSAVVVRPDMVTREVTLSIHSKGDTDQQALGEVSLVLPAALACQLGTLLLASGQTLDETAKSEGGAA